MAYRPYAWLHPWALQIQGSVLGFMCLAWIGIRALARRLAIMPKPETRRRMRASA